MRSLCLAVIAAILLGCSSRPSLSPAPVAQAPVHVKSGDSATASPKTLRKDGTEVICRREPVPNSRLGGQKVCLTRKEWEQRANLASDAFREQQRPPTAPDGD